MRHGRRGRKEGSIYKRADGRWAGAIDLGYSTGRRKRKVVYGLTRSEVFDKLQKKLAEQSQGFPIASVGRLNMERFLNDWLATIKPNVRIRTYERYETIVRLHLVPPMGHIRIERLTPVHVQALLDEKLAAGLSPRTVQSIRIVLRSALQKAVKWQMLARNVADVVDAPRMVNREMCALSPSEARTFLIAATDDRLYALYLLGLACGLRRGELLGLKWSDLDLDAKTLAVRRSLGRSINGIVIDEPKTARGKRTVKLADSIVAALRAHRAAQAREHLKAGAKWQPDSEWVFTTSIGTAIDPRNLVSEFHDLLKRSKVSTAINFHGLRHSYATIALAAGVHPKIVSETLGHSRISLTLDTYSHSLPTLQAESADRVANVLVG